MAIKIGEVNLTNEVVEKISDTEAKVSFDITDLDGLTRLSSSEEIG